MLSLRRLIPGGVAALVYGVLGAEPACAWGLGTHVKLAYDLLADLAWLPASAAALLSKYWLDYIYGNIATDYVFAKRLSRVKQFCHHWRTGFGIFESAESARGRAFALGYLSHLAADTVAHNKYVPHQLTVTRTTMELGHAYWEMRADLLIDGAYWARLRRLLVRRFWDHEALLEKRLNATLLRFHVNRELFRQVNLLISHDAARTIAAAWERWSRFPLSRPMVGAYHRECLDRMIDIISEGPKSALVHEDPNGQASLADIRRHRRYVRHLARLGMVTPPLLAQAASRWYPRPWPLSNGKRSGADVPADSPWVSLPDEPTEGAGRLLVGCPE